MSPRLPKPILSREWRLRKVVHRYVEQLKIFFTAAPLVSTLAATAVSSVFGTAAYIGYKVYHRERRIMNTFAQGNILKPLTKMEEEVRMYPRKQAMDKLRHILRSEITNQYYLVFGEVGTGKTRLMTETIHHMIETDGAQGKGAPVYVLASQGESFPDSFANAVFFQFDEHINFKFFLDFVFRVGQLPERDEESKLKRLLFALEKAAFRYLQETGKPAVLVIDGVDWLTERMPDALNLLQEKAKVWADTNIAKLVFVSNDEKTEELMRMHHSAWSRAALPIVLEDLSVEETKEFLLYPDPIIKRSTAEIRKRKRQTYYKPSDHIIENESAKYGRDRDIVPDMPEEHMEEIINLVGGRIQNLLVAKWDWYKGSSFDETVANLKFKERYKFIEVMKEAKSRLVIETLHNQPEHSMLMSDLVDLTSREDVFTCAFHNVIRIERDGVSGLTVKFESRLTEVVVHEMFENLKAKEQKHWFSHVKALVAWPIKYFN